MRRNRGRDSDMDKKEVVKSTKTDKANKKGQVKLMVSIVLMLSALGLCYFAITRYSQIQERLCCLTQLSSNEGGEVAQGQIASGMHLKNISLGDKSYAEAEEHLKDREEGLISRLGRIKLQYTAEGEEIELERSPYDLGLRLDIDKIMETAISESKKLIGRQTEIPVSYTLDEEILQGVLLELEEDINQEGQDAKAESFDYEKRQFVFTEAQEGRELDVAKLEALIRDCLQKEEYDAQISLPIEFTEAGRSSVELQADLGLISSASTPIMEYSEARNTNIRVAGDRINGTILQPGQSFSYNSVIGAMTEGNGFVAAGIQDEFGNSGLGVGGGLCQPSTTLYIAAVRAGMHIDVHHYHTNPVTYTPLGTDAMVSDWADLVFTNVSDSPCIIMFSFDGSTVQFDFFGKPHPNGERLDLYVEFLGDLEPEEPPKEQKDETLPVGTVEEKVAPRPGKHVKVYTNRYDAAGNVIGSTLIEEHKYPYFRGLNLVNKDESAENSSTNQGGVPTNPDGTPVESSPPPLTGQEVPGSPPPIGN